MFPTFTGNSRKSRNVNLSGQRAINPFTSTSWSPASPVGASQTVAHAQAERQQRQQERDRLKAALRIQRSWRGHRVRRGVRLSRRQLLDQLYSGGATVDALQRSIRGLPLILAVFQASKPEDHKRVRRVAQDLVQTRFGAFASGAVDASRMDKLTRVLIAVLERLDTGSLQSQAQILLEAVDGILNLRPQSLEQVLAQYYKVLGMCCHQIGPTSHSLDLVRNAVVAPLIATHTTRTFIKTAYHEFAFSYLSQHDLLLFEQNIGSFVEDIDLDHLSSSLLAAPPKDPKTPEAQSAVLWLLAHFVSLHKSKETSESHPQYLKTLYSLLCVTSDQIRAGFAPPDSRGSGERELDEAPEQNLPPYVSNSLATLIDKDEISGLLERFTVNYGESPDSELEDASFLAGYILTLMYCFPGLGDDIRMRLYLADISTRNGPVPAMKFFWDAMIKTSIFSAIASNEDATLDVLRHQRSSAQFGAATTHSQWHREWRTALLFLELYVFVLRLTDDDDFFGGLNPAMDAKDSGSRLRSSSLSKQELQRLTRFLKHLSFTLYYNPPESLTGVGLGSDTQGNLDGLLAHSARRRSPLNPGDRYKAATFVITAGIDFSTFRNLVTTTMRMLYERDSRRPFLPDGHWLMTSKFDMGGFLSAVVLEERRQHDIREAGEDDDEDGNEDADEDNMDVDEHITQTYAGQRRSHHAYMERLRAQQKKAARERMLAAHGPKLEILRNMPFVIPFETRVQLFRQFVHLDMERRRGATSAFEGDRWRPMAATHQAQITRGRVFTDAMSAFWDLNDKLKEPIQITFVDEFGMQEAGIDGGGVTKEFLTSVTQEAFTQDQRLFITNSNNSYYPNPCAVDQQREALRAARIPEESNAWRESMADLLRQYEFLGRIIGKCMYEGILINITFGGFFLLKWATANADTYRASINDLRELDEELYQGMMRLKNYSGDVTDLDLDFTITDQVSLPDEPVRTVTRNLVTGGDKVPVTNENRPLYISYVARHRLMVQPFQQTRAFLRGLGMIIDPGWLSMFNQTELQRLVGGDSSEIDVEDLRRHTVYGGVYEIGEDGEEHPTVKLFWEVLHGLEDEERREVLKYVTSTPRAPLLGFSQLRPAFGIRDGGSDEDRLPSASTCVNLLKLPRYKTAAVLRSKLLYAVKSGAGFDLS
ncbi:hypothetical protein B0H67DRAFT_311243 [Lasiosphaeris hirsuta]|uniref:HECT-type E3 ubiquitin transferase n=1 Tax=Lasiosphaeris hirsuta TaxID=260670 RepID=A0AA40A187_9PEZI|nr:hypothetical protein B0H67DRAFT_311243 [Lasiosphaeris hirsuta]